VEKPQGASSRRINPGCLGSSEDRAAAVAAAPRGFPPPSRQAPSRSVRLTHWANALLLVGMIAAGCRSTWLSPLGPRAAVLPEPVGRQAFPLSMRLGAGSPAAQLALRPGLAVRPHRTALPWLSGVHRRMAALLFRPDVPRAWQMQLYYLRLRQSIRHRASTTRCKAAITSILLLASSRCSPGSPSTSHRALVVDSPLRGYQLARYCTSGRVGFRRLHSRPRDPGPGGGPRSLRAMITGWYRGRFPSHDYDRIRALQSPRSPAAWADACGRFARHGVRLQGGPCCRPSGASRLNDWVGEGLLSSAIWRRSTAPPPHPPDCSRLLHQPPVAAAH